MNTEVIEQLFAEIYPYRTRGRRSVHKPLLVLYALARCAKREARELAYTKEFDQKFSQLLGKFGTSEHTNTSHRPFSYLRSDRIWKFYSDSPLRVPSGREKEVPKSELLKYEVRAGFTEEIHETLSNDFSLLARVARRLLDSHFPESIHQEILDSVELDLSDELRRPRRRDPSFRDKVLMAYQYQCAVCGFSVYLGERSIGLEAAHVKWFQYGGPNIINNGIAFCILHHKIFDLGGFTVNKDFQIEVSQHLRSGAIENQSVQRHFLEFHGKQIQPQSTEYLPGREYLEWHRKEVFKDPPRKLA